MLNVSWNILGASWTISTLAFLIRVATLIDFHPFSDSGYYPARFDTFSDQGCYPNRFPFFVGLGMLLRYATLIYFGTTFSIRVATLIEFGLFLH